jgi:flagellar biosynthesis GTPase FlhF
MEARTLSRRNTFASEDIIKLIHDNDLSDYNTFLVLNGGTGVGKTSSIMKAV